VVDLLDCNVASFLQTLLTERMLADVTVTDFLPRSAVALAGGVTSGKLFVVPPHKLHVFFAVGTVS
jgi:hypothetical protein